MTATDIIDMLEGIGRSATPRLSPAVALSAATATARRERILQAIRGTVLPRRLEFSTPGGTLLAIEVNSARITDVYGASTGELPDFETEPREVLVGKMARLISDIASAGGPVHLVSRQPDGPLEADDVGITFTEIRAACQDIEVSSEPHMAIVPDPVADTESSPSLVEPKSGAGLAQAFFEDASRFALGRFLAGLPDAAPQSTGECAEGQPLHPDSDLLDRFARDLAGWDSDSAGSMAHPQMIVMRPAGGKGAAVAILRDGQSTAAAVHDARKLGAVVALWKSLRGADP